VQQRPETLFLAAVHLQFIGKIQAQFSEQVDERTQQDSAGEAVEDAQNTDILHPGKAPAGRGTCTRDSPGNWNGWQP